MVVFPAMRINKQGESKGEETYCLIMVNNCRVVIRFQVRSIVKIDKKNVEYLSIVVVNQHDVVWTDVAV